MLQRGLVTVVSALSTSVLESARPMWLLPGLSLQLLGESPAGSSGRAYRSRALAVVRSGVATVFLRAHQLLPPVDHYLGRLIAAGFGVRLFIVSQRGGYALVIGVLEYILTPG